MGLIVVSMVISKSLIHQTLYCRFSIIISFAGPSSSTGPSSLPSSLSLPSQCPPKHCLIHLLCHPLAAMHDVECLHFWQHNHW